MSNISCTLKCLVSFARQSLLGAFGCVLFFFCLVEATALNRREKRGFIFPLNEIHRKKERRLLPAFLFNLSLFLFGLFFLLGYKGSAMIWVWKFLPWPYVYICEDHPSFLPPSHPCCFPQAKFLMVQNQQQLALFFYAGWCDR